MQKQIHQMVALGIQAKKLAVCHVRQPREGMPVTVKPGFKGPDKSFPGQSGPHLGILHHVPVIVEGDKVVGDDAPEDRQVGDNK